MLVLPVLFLLRALLLSGHVEAQSSTLEIMKLASMSLTEPLTCDKWDCDCTFNRQRSCCCGANEMYQLEDSIYERIKNLWQGVSTLKYSVMDLSGGYKIAFKATMDPNNIDGSLKGCFGIFTSNVPIPYTSISLNDGNGYNPTLGAFTAPRAGVYLFSATVYSSVEKDGRLYHKVQMMLNNIVVASVWEDNREDTEDSATQVAVLELKRGDQVYMELMFGRKLCNHLQHNTFTGFMLYPETNE
ncbi:cerebellin-1 [Notolabrus celidotus]|uniref:cerebellin-1 n=1 Tax=Notolabrus celidotus TaxID=1203425 RepID=UPI00148F7BBC|nr:cerebellin-1 [Notolabrus celidotus]